jgi:hypothetical protein
MKEREGEREGEREDQSRSKSTKSLNEQIVRYENILFSVVCLFPRRPQLFCIVEFIGSD